MKQLQAFLAQIKEAGINCQVNEVIALDKGSMLEFYTFKHEGNSINVMFWVQGDDNGFTHYIESNTNKIDLSVVEIKEALAV